MLGKIVSIDRSLNRDASRVMRTTNGWADPNCARDKSASSSRHPKRSLWKLCNEYGTPVFSTNGCSMQNSYGFDCFSSPSAGDTACEVTAQTFYSADSVENEDEPLFSIEYLQSLNIAGMALHAAKFKVGCPVMLLRNLDPAAGLCNGTRLLSTRLHTRVLEAIILIGNYAGQPVLLPRITLKTGSSAELPFTLHRTQFPIRLAMAMTFNKLQGPSLAQVGVCLETPVFSHGQVVCRVVPSNEYGRCQVISKLHSSVHLIVLQRVNGYGGRWRAERAAEPNDFAFDRTNVGNLPSNYVCKIVGPAMFLPILSLLFGVFSLAMAFVQTFPAASVAMRFLKLEWLKVAERILHLMVSRTISRDGTARTHGPGFRLAMPVYVVCTPLAGACGGLLASGLLRVPSFGPIHTWRMIFFAEGLLTIIIAAESFFFLADRPETAKWLSAEEKALCAARTKSENVGALVVVDELKSRVFFEGMFNLIPSIIGGFLFMFDNLIVQGLGFYLPSIVKEIFPEMSTVGHQIRTVPPYLVGVATAILLPYLSWKTKKRALWMSLTIPVMITGYALFVVSDNASIRYGACFLIASGCFALVSSCNTWSAINTTSDTARAEAIAMTVLGGNLDGLLLTWTYLPQYVPHQLPGNIMNLGASCLLLIFTIVSWGWQHRQNVSRDRGHMDHVLDGKLPEENSRLGTRHPGFR
ncbi:BZ3500_MvSof-1268-A1-R1_Chr2-1g04148 [Microbotryum saponariae]|uniref:BZ3500_MvSof-1268-A1-R1_Chr2-1g04148 protein n=1 Tax=Microbotryum saponariae TaxID=289078 RepID=A0A2X0K9S0_9BASI|nr:BZ3500_MvSof-1268-A1-R1_Chr2-1g04148 [Microbotryum saponariae]SCZ91135.1 BZ3501_MvSof-1269-A2-R1_Chr2-1g03804 [Microbotryum saponariae]